MSWQNGHNMEINKGEMSSVWQDKKSFEFCLILPTGKIYRDTFNQVLGVRKYLVSTEQGKGIGTIWTNDSLARYVMA